MKKFLLLLIFSFLLFAFFILAVDGVEINTASLEELEILTGIGPVKAQAIIDDRPFSSVDDLIRVKGIGEKTLQKIKDQGLAYVSSQSQSSPPPPPPAPPPPPPQNEQTNEQTNENLSENTNAANPQSDTLNIPPVVPNPASNPAPEIKGVFINEILPNTEGADEENEWIELYNSNNFEVDLSKWKINDISGIIITYTLAENIKISANGFLLLKRADTKITLNNDWDGLNLSAPNEKIMDSITYSSAPKNQSYNRTGSGWQWSITLTPGAMNIINTAVKNLPEPKKSVKNNSVELGLADISQDINTNQEELKTTNPWFLFFTALVITIISAVFVLIIKLKFFKKDVRT